MKLLSIILTIETKKKTKLFDHLAWTFYLFQKRRKVTGKKLIQYMRKVRAIANNSIEKKLQFSNPTMGDNYNCKIDELLSSIWSRFQPATIADVHPFTESTDRVPWVCLLTCMMRWIQCHIILTVSWTRRRRKPPITSTYSPFLKVEASPFTIHPNSLSFKVWCTCILYRHGLQARHFCPKRRFEHYDWFHYVAKWIKWIWTCIKQ